MMLGASVLFCVRCHDVTTALQLTVQMCHRFSLHTRIHPSNPADVQCGTGVALAAPSTCKSTSNCPPALTDQQALMGWKASLSGNTSRLASWQGPNPCSASQPWSGVTCSEDGFAVVALNVSGFGLSGPLPPVQDIKQLQVCLCTWVCRMPLLHSFDTIADDCAMTLVKTT